MLSPAFLPMPLTAWQPTRDTLNLYAKIPSGISRVLSPAHPHWWHVSLRTTSTGLATQRMPITPQTDPSTTAWFCLELNLVEHALVLEGREGVIWSISLLGQSPKSLSDSLFAALAQINVHANVDREPFSDPTPRPYDPISAGRYFRILSQLDLILQKFKAELPGETSPVQTWAHHFDTSLVWFSGRTAPGVDPENREYADEQMAFGFSTGDESIPDPYVYITAYPWPEGLAKSVLPGPAYWHTDGWNGGVIPFNSLFQESDPAGHLAQILRIAHRAGADLMR